MKLLSFLAGLATGILLSRSASAQTASTGVQSESSGANARGNDSVTRLNGAPATGDEGDAFVQSTPESDEQLRNHIRAQFARTLSRPEAIEVEVRDGCVTLRGQAPATEAILLLNEVQTTAGVRDVRNALELQGSLADVLPAQGQPGRRGAEEASSHMS